MLNPVHQNSGLFWNMQEFFKDLVKSDVFSLEYPDAELNLIHTKNTSHFTWRYRLICHSLTLWKLKVVIHFVDNLLHIWHNRQSFGFWHCVELQFDTDILKEHVASIFRVAELCLGGHKSDYQKELLQHLLQHPTIQKMESENFSEMLVSSYNPTQCQHSDDCPVISTCHVSMKTWFETQKHLQRFINL